MKKHAFGSFSVADFDTTARTFWDNGYQSVTAIRDMDARGRDFSPKQIQSGTSNKRTVLADMRLTLKIFAWFGPQERIRSGNTPFDEIWIESRMENWAVDFSRISHGFEPVREMVNFFSCELEKGRTSRPPYSQYVTTDSSAVQPWMPTDEPPCEGAGAMAD